MLSEAQWYGWWRGELISHAADKYNIYQYISYPPLVSLTPPHPPPPTLIHKINNKSGRLIFVFPNPIYFFCLRFLLLSLKTRHLLWQCNQFKIFQLTELVKESSRYIFFKQKRNHEIFSFTSSSTWFLILCSIPSE